MTQLSQAPEGREVPAPRCQNRGVVLLVTLVLCALVASGLAWILRTQHETQVQSTQILGRNLRQVMRDDGTANVAAASAAVAAQSKATQHAMPLSALSATFLNSALPSMHWVDSTTTFAYTSNGRHVVGFGVQDGHILTAVEPLPGQCNFGLVVTSPTDPIIAADHLGGPGTFGSNVGSATPHCGVASAPASWLPVKPQPLSSLARLNWPPSDCRSSSADGSASVACPFKGMG